MKTQNEMKALLIAEVKAQHDFYCQEIDLLVSEYKRLGMTNTILEFETFRLEVDMRMSYASGNVVEDGRSVQRFNLHRFEYGELGPKDVAAAMREQLYKGFERRERHIEEAIEALRVAEAKVQTCERYERREEVETQP